MCCDLLCFFFSSRRRHTRCALVTGVQTCALPIYRGDRLLVVAALVVGVGGFDQRLLGVGAVRILRDQPPVDADRAAPVAAVHHLLAPLVDFLDRRSEERRVGNECVSTCRSRWSTYHTKKNTETNTYICR